MPGDMHRFEIDMTALQTFSHEIDMNGEEILSAWLARDDMDDILEKITLTRDSFADTYGRSIVLFFFRIVK